MGHLKNVLVTGANGFLGSHLLDVLIKNGYLPIAYLRVGSDIWRIKHLQNSYIPFITTGNNEAEIEELFKSNKIQAIFHTATDYGRMTSLSNIIETNVIFPLKLIEAGIKYQTKLFINSDTFFGKKHFALNYLNNYIISKRIFESILLGLSSKIKIVNLRIEHIYGENDSDQKFVTSILKQLIQNTNEILFTEGNQKRDFIYVKDVANAYLSVLKNTSLLEKYQEFEVGTGKSISVKEFILKLAEVTASKSFLKFGTIPLRDGEILNSIANTSQLNKLGWKVQYNLDSAISTMVTTEKNRYSDEN